MKRREGEEATEAALARVGSLKAVMENGARVMGRADEPGTVQPGKLAEFVLLNADLFDDIGHRSTISLVNREGTPYE